MQKKAIRLVTKSKSNTPPYPLFSQLKILPLEHLITLTSGQLIHSIYHKYAPKALHNLWMTNEQRGINHDLRDAHLLYVPLPELTMSKDFPTLLSLSSGMSSLTVNYPVILSHSKLA